jgi:hypothetical protein
MAEIDEIAPERLLAVRAEASCVQHPLAVAPPWPDERLP